MGPSWQHPPEAHVPAPLRPHVVAMYGFEAHGLEPGVHRGLPSDSLTLVLSLDEPLCTAPSAQAWDDGVRDTQWVTVGGLHTRAAIVDQPGRWRGVQLSLDPLGTRALLGVPAADLPAGSWDPVDLLGTEAERVVADLQAARDWPARYTAVTDFLLRLSRVAGAGTGPAPPRPEVREAWRLLTRRQDLGVADVARHVGYSRRRLTQLLTAEVGHGPKTVQRLARFDAARRAVALSAASGTTLAAVAARCGYHDQSHLVRDFHDFAGLSPSAWLAAEFPNLQAVHATDARTSSA